MQAWTIGLPTVSRQLAIACSLERARACTQLPVVASNASKAAAVATPNGFDLCRAPEAEGLNDLGMERLPVNMNTHRTNPCQICPKIFRSFLTEPDHG